MSELLNQLRPHLEKLGFVDLHPRAKKTTSEAEKALADIEAEITATLEYVKAHIRANAKEDAEQASQQETVTPACHPQLLKAFGILMRRVGAPPEEGAPGPVQKAVMGLAEGSEVSVENFFDRAHMADVTARRAKLEAKITRGDRPTKQGK